MSAVLEQTPTTVKTYLRPIDRDGLMAFADKGRNNPASRGTNKVHTVMEGQYRSLSYVGNHAPVVANPISYQITPSLQETTQVTFASGLVEPDDDIFRIISHIEFASSFMLP